MAAWGLFPRLASSVASFVPPKSDAAAAAAAAATAATAATTDTAAAAASAPTAAAAAAAVAAPNFYPRSPLAWCSVPSAAATPASLWLVLGPSS
jgi:hypothetical protein